MDAEEAEQGTEWAAMDRLMGTWGLEEEKGQGTLTDQQESLPIDQTLERMRSSFLIEKETSKELVRSQFVRKMKTETKATQKSCITDVTCQLDSSTLELSCDCIRQHMPVILALGKQRGKQVSDFKGSLVYIEGSQGYSVRSYLK